MVQRVLSVFELLTKQGKVVGAQQRLTHLVHLLHHRPLNVLIGPRTKWFSPGRGAVTRMRFSVMMWRLGQGFFGVNQCMIMKTMPLDRWKMGSGELPCHRCHLILRNAFISAATTVRDPDLGATQKPTQLKVRWRNHEIIVVSVLD